MAIVQERLTRRRGKAVSTSGAVSKSRKQLDQERVLTGFPHGINWPVLAWLAVLHVGALAAPFTFSWSGLALLLGLHWLTGGIGVCLGFHRLLTHQSFKTFRPIELLLAAIGGLAGEGSALYWVANHRKHHALSDQEGDPHSPRDGGWWSHVLWVLPMTTRESDHDHIHRWTPDLADDKAIQRLDALFLPIQIAFGLSLLAAGWAIGGWQLGLSWLVWGQFARVVFVLHSTWFVNSASHMWGYINYKTKDDSRNNWWVALLTYGEGWHNNHHAYPRLACHGHRWWEVDLTYQTIKLMSAVGLAWDVSDTLPAKKARAQAEHAPAELPSLPATPVAEGDDATGEQAVAQ